VYFDPLSLKNELNVEIGIQSICGFTNGSDIETLTETDNRLTMNPTLIKQVI